MITKKHLDEIESLKQKLVNVKVKAKNLKSKVKTLKTTHAEEVEILKASHRESLTIKDNEICNLRAFYEKTSAQFEPEDKVTEQLEASLGEKDPLSQTQKKVIELEAKLE